MGVIAGESGEDDGGAVGEFGYQGEVAAHGFNGLAECGKEQVAALFEARDAVLGDAELAGDADLSELARFAEFAEGHFLGQ